MSWPPKLTELLRPKSSSICSAVLTQHRLITVVGCTSLAPGRAGKNTVRPVQEGTRKSRTQDIGHSDIGHSLELRPGFSVRASKSCRSATTVNVRMWISIWLDDRGRHREISTAICRPSGCTAAPGVVGVIVGVCNRSQMRKCACLIFGVSIDLDPGYKRTKGNFDRCSRSHATYRRPSLDGF